jgi:hypothetical protein
MHHRPSVRFGLGFGPFGGEYGWRSAALDVHELGAMRGFEEEYRSAVSRRFGESRQFDVVPPIGSLALKFHVARISPGGDRDHELILISDFAVGGAAACRALTPGSTVPCRCR